MDPDQIPEVHCAKIDAAVNVIRIGYEEWPESIPSELFDLRQKAVKYLDEQFTTAGGPLSE